MRVLSVGMDAAGFIAIGQRATGVIAIGQLAIGVVAIGQLARGVVAIGQLSCGVLSIGQLSLGAVWSGGMVAVGPTAGFALLPLGLLGRWVPWRRRSDARRSEQRRPGVMRSVLAAACVALVLAIAMVPLGRALFSEGGVMNDPTPVLR